MASAAFGRLCVETTTHRLHAYHAFSAAFGRLCVETDYGLLLNAPLYQPPSGGCVLKPPFCLALTVFAPFSRLRAAVC